MNEYIKKEDALDCFHAWLDKYGDVNLPDDMPEYQAIENLPAADVVERKKGMWLYWWDEPDYDTYECSVCGASFNIPDGNPLEHNYKFCPNCGADMRGET